MFLSAGQIFLCCCRCLLLYLGDLSGVRCSCFKHLHSLVWVGWIHITHLVLRLLRVEKLTKGTAKGTTNHEDIYLIFPESKFISSTRLPLNNEECSTWLRRSTFAFGSLKWKHRQRCSDECSLILNGARNSCAQNFQYCVVLYETKRRQAQWFHI